MIVVALIVTCLENLLEPSDNYKGCFRSVYTCDELHFCCRPLSSASFQYLCTKLLLLLQNSKWDLERCMHESVTVLKWSLSHVCCHCGNILTSLQCSAANLLPCWYSKKVYYENLQGNELGCAASIIITTCIAIDAPGQGMAALLAPHMSSSEEICVAMTPVVVQISPHCSMATVVLPLVPK